MVASLFVFEWANCALSLGIFGIEGVFGNSVGMKNIK